MKTTIKLTEAQHGLLCEALRRYCRFGMKDEKRICEAWTGLGSATEYRPAAEAGFMDYATSPNPRHMVWWKLTPLGAEIVKVWLAKGYTDAHVEGYGGGEGIPPYTVTLHE